MANALAPMFPMVQDDMRVAYTRFATPDAYAARLLRVIHRGPSPPDLGIHHNVAVHGNIESLGPDHHLGFLLRCIPWVSDAVVNVNVLINNGPYVPGGGIPPPLVHDRDFRDAVADRLANAGFPIADVPQLTSVLLTVQRPSGGHDPLQGTGLLATYLPVCQRLWINANDVACANLAAGPMPTLRALHVRNAVGGHALWWLGGGGKSVADAILANPQVQTLTLSRELATGLATLLVGLKVLVEGGLRYPNSEGSTSLVTLSDPSLPWHHHWVETQPGSSEDDLSLREALEALGVPHYTSPALEAGRRPDPYWSRVLKPRGFSQVLPGAMTDLVHDELVASRSYDGLEDTVNLTVLLELLGAEGSAEVHGRLLRWLVTMGPRSLGYRPE